jgi:hypothetical protein
MTKLLDQAIEAARALPPEMQDEIARAILRLAGDDEPLYELAPEEEADLAYSLAQMERGEFASEEQVKAVWARYL